MRFKEHAVRVIEKHNYHWATTLKFMTELRAIDKDKDKKEMKKFKDLVKKFESGQYS